MQECDFHPSFQPPELVVDSASSAAGENPSAGSAKGRRLRQRAEERKGWVFTPSIRPVVREGKPVGRNKPCRCGSGRKRKACHPD